MLAFLIRVAFGFLCGDCWFVGFISFLCLGLRFGAFYYLVWWVWFAAW